MENADLLACGQVRVERRSADQALQVGIAACAAKPRKQVCVLHRGSSVEALQRMVLNRPQATRPAAGSWANLTERGHPNAGKITWHIGNGEQHEQKADHHTTACQTLDNRVTVHGRNSFWRSDKACKASGSIGAAHPP